MTPRLALVFLILPLLLAGCGGATRYEREVNARPEPATPEARKVECRWVDDQLGELYMDVETRGLFGPPLTSDQRAFYLEHTRVLANRAARYSCQLVPPKNYRDCTSRFWALFGWDQGQLFLKCADMPDSPAHSGTAR